MNRKRFDKVERREVTKTGVADAIEKVLLVLRGKSRNENREPNKVELERRYRLDGKTP